MLDTFFNRETGWGGGKPITPMRRVAGRVPALGYAFVPLDAQPAGDDLVADGDRIENAHYRVRVDPASGAVIELFDKEQGHDFAGSYEGLGIGQYLYETVDSPEGRVAIAAFDFSHPDFFVGEKNTPWNRRTATSVTAAAAAIEHGRAFIDVAIEGDGIDGASCRFALDSRRKALTVEWTLHKLHVTDPEAILFAFPFALDGADVTIDLNGVPSVPNDDQLDGAAKDWYPLQRWVDVSDDARGVTLVPLDAPLVHLGGITTGKWARTLDPEGPTIMSWAINNHWLVNFKASQGGRIPFRYALTTHDGPVDSGRAARFAAEVLTPPLVMRDRSPTGERSDSFFSIPDDASALVTAKPASDGNGIVLRVQNLDRTPQQLPLTFHGTPPASARLTSPIEVDSEALASDGATLTIPLDGLAVRSVRVTF
jgi:hypothetical protein